MFSLHTGWIASKHGWSLYFKVVLRVFSVQFSTVESGLEYLEIFKFFTLFEKKLFNASAASDSAFKISPLSFIKIFPLSIIYQGVKPLLFNKTFCLFNKTFCYQLIPVHVRFQTFRSSRPEVFSELLCEKHAIRNFAEVCNILLKMRLWCSCFPVNFEKFSKKAFSYRTPCVLHFCKRDTE